MGREAHSMHTASGQDQAAFNRDLLMALVNNAIPAIGVVFFGWSVSLILLLYWLENLTGSILWHRIVRRHEALTGLRGHFRNQMGVSANNRQITRFSSEHATGSIVFTAGHGIFLFVFAAALLDGATLLAQWHWVMLLAGAVVAGTAAEILPHHRQLERQSFAWLRAQAKISLWPVITMHLGVIFGGMALAMESSGVAMAVLFIALRVVVDIGRAHAKKNARWREPPTPPRVPDTLQPGSIREAMYKAQLAEYEEQLRDEEVCPPEERPRD